MYDKADGGSGSGGGTGGSGRTDGPELPPTGDPESEQERTFDSDADREEETAPPANEETVAHEKDEGYNEEGTSNDRFRMDKESDELRMSDKQFGKKVGKHARDFGFDPSDPKGRVYVKSRVDQIFRNATEVRQGEWRGLGETLPNGMRMPGQAKFYIQGKDVVVVDMDGNFITIMKDGINNLRVQAAKKIWTKQKGDKNV